MKKPARQAVQLAGAMGLAQLLVAVAYAVAARATSAASFGVAVSAVAIAAVLAGVLDFGQSAYLAREASAGRLEEHLLFQRLSQKLTLHGVLVGWATVLTILAANALGVSRGWLAFVASLTLVNVLLQAGQTQLRAKGLSDRIAISMSLGRLALLAIVLGGTTSGWPGDAALKCGLLIAVSLDALICWTLSVSASSKRASVLRALRPGHPRTWSQAWAGSRGYGYAAAFGAAQQLDTPLLSMFAGPSAAGVYGAVSRWTAPLILPSSAVAQVGAPFAAKSSDLRSAVKSLGRAWSLVALSVVGCLVVAATASWLAPMILGSEYESSGPVLAVLAVGVIPTVVAQPVAMVLQSRGLEVGVSIAMGAALLTRYGVTVALGHALLGMAGAVGVLVQQSLLLVILLAMAVRLVRKESEDGVLVR